MKTFSTGLRKTFAFLNAARESPVRRSQRISTVYFEIIFSFQNWLIDLSFFFEIFLLSLPKRFLAGIFLK
jgi:hypothetical protein